MTATLYGFSISNPSISAKLMLEHKGIEYEWREIPTGWQHPVMRMRGFKAGTVPGLMIEGRRFGSSMEIARGLEEIRPDPPLYPADPASRRAVEEAEAWGDEVLQNVPRRAYRWALAHDRGLRLELARTVGIPLPGLTAALGGPMAAHYARRASADERGAREVVERLPQTLDHIDALIAEGTIGGPEPNAADFQIGPSVRLLLTFADFRPAIEGRPAEEHARGLVPDFPGNVRSFLPPEWLAPLKAATVAAD